MQFLKFQAFAEQLTKEIQELKVKIETLKRENRRLTSLIEQQKDDATRLTARLNGTEKQRDDALEALVLQQEIAEELERERKRNNKELSALQHTNATIIRQRDESQRVVVHLRSLIDGQTHHMEHIVRSLNKAPELTNYIGEGYEDSPEDAEDHESIIGSEAHHDDLDFHESESRRLFPQASTNGKLDTEHVTPEMESRFFSSLVSNSKSGSRLSIANIADRHLRDKTDAIADIIRNISDQCAAAVEGLQLAHEAEDGDQLEPHLLKQNGHLTHSHKHTTSDGDASMHTDVSQLGANSDNGAEDDDQDQDQEHDSGHGGSTGFLTPIHERGNSTGGRDSRQSSIPPTPDLVGGGRSSTSMSGYSNSTGVTPDRASQQWQQNQQLETRTKILDTDEQGSQFGLGGEENGDGGVDGGKRGSEGRPVTARMVGV